MNPASFFNSNLIDYPTTKRVHDSLPSLDFPNKKLTLLHDHGSNLEPLSSQTTNSLQNVTFTLAGIWTILLITFLSFLSSAERSLTKQSAAVPKFVLVVVSLIVRVR